LCCACDSPWSISVPIRHNYCVVSAFNHGQLVFPSELRVRHQLLCCACDSPCPISVAHQAQLLCCACDSPCPISVPIRHYCVVPAILHGQLVLPIRHNYCVVAAIYHVQLVFPSGTSHCVILPNSVSNSYIISSLLQVYKIHHVIITYQQDIDVFGRNSFSEVTYRDRL
jgi:hypothetical protein